MNPPLQAGPLVSAGTFIGIGLGGFVDGIVFHQVLQVHNMLSAVIPPDDLLRTKINMVWDGYFHAAVWCITVAGVVLLFRAGQRPDAAWSGRMLLGSALAGWGLFNLVEGVIDHHILGLHHVVENASSHWPGDLAFLASGVVLVAVGVVLVRRGVVSASAPGQRPSRRSG